MAGIVDFQSYAGPGDRDLRHSMVEGAQPVNPTGQVVQNAYIDPHEFQNLPHHMSYQDVSGKAPAEDGGGSGGGGVPGADYETRPMFHEWATVHAGMVCLSRKKKSHRSYRGVETALPVIGCAACIKKKDEGQYFFAGVSRSKSVREPDDGMGPKTDEFFTTAMRGMVTILNNSGQSINAGDDVAWTLFPAGSSATTPAKARSRTMPRRIGVQACSVSSSKRIGRALSFAKNGENFDLLIN